MGVVPWDYFHLGLLLVVIMVFITGIVICVAVTGVCCFHWLDSKQSQADSHKSAHRTRDEGAGVDNSLNERLKHLQEKKGKEDVPPPYEVLFPNEPPMNFDLSSPIRAQIQNPDTIHYV